MDLLIKFLLAPVSQLALCFFLLAMSVLLRSSWQRPLAVLSLTLLALLTNKPLADFVAAPLEWRFSKLQGEPSAHIQVLGCSHSEAEFLPLSNMPDLCSVARLTEAAQLWQRNKTAIIHLSGEIPHHHFPHTQVSEDFLQGLGVPATSIRRHVAATNTEQEIALVSRYLHGQPVALVTSAMHMPRAIKWAQFYQLNAIAAPTHFQIRRPPYQWPEQWSELLPSGSALDTFRYAFYEYAGLIKADADTGLFASESVGNSLSGVR